MNEALRLHADEQGVVWCGQNGVRAFRSGLPPGEFVRRSVFRDAQEIRLLGVPQNANLILAIHEERKRLPVLGTKRTILLGSPRTCYREPMLADPVFVLQQLWQSDLPAKVQGNWHHLDERDYNTYLLIRAMQETGSRVGTMAEQVVKYHPIWQAVSFLPEYDLHAAIKLACEIVDPRWYNDCRRPGRAQKLFMYLGIEPRNLQAFAGIIPPSNAYGCRNWERASLVLAAWGGLNSSTNVDLDDPRNFLWRIYREAGGGAKGLLKASKAFVRFIRLVWLQELARKPREVFSPEVYFKHDCEIKAYRKHRERRPQS